MVVGEMVEQVDLVVVGGGPGGYTAAIRAAELGIKTMLVDDQPMPGGVCLHMGCIPSKALLHAAEVLNTAKEAHRIGIKFDDPNINLDTLRSWKEDVLSKLAQGVSGLLKRNKVDHLVGKVRFIDSKNLRVDREGESNVRVKFKHAIVATGSRPTKLPMLFKNKDDMKSPLVMDSTGALKIENIPDKLLVIGGGYIGLEMSTVYQALGTKVTVVEMMDNLLPGVDKDLVRPLATRLESHLDAIHLETKVVSLEVKNEKVIAHLEGKDVPEKMEFDKVLIAVGRQPNSNDLGLEETDVEIDKHGFVKVDDEQRTADKRILAIGDVCGQPMLAHRAIRQGFVAAEILAGKPSKFDNPAIPAVVFTEPEVAWCGLTESEAKEKGIKVQSARFPWSASGRAMTLADPIGHTKIIFDPETQRVMGLGVVGPRAGDLVAEGVLAIEAGCVLEDLAVSIHAHPTLSETINEAAVSALARLERQAAQSTLSSR